MNIKDFIEKFIKAEDEAWINRNFMPLAALEDPKVVYHFIVLGADIDGFAAHKQQILDSLASYSDIKQDWKYLTGEGNLFALLYEAHYISNGTVPGLPPAGGKVDVNLMFLFRLKNEKIVEAWVNGTMKGIDFNVYLK
ncbi:MAG: ester cyclase [Dehalococcoidales bacterium]|nr:ester cyclase [Dehalococcoidales bacterium]